MGHKEDDSDLSDTGTAGRAKETDPQLAWADRLWSSARLADTPRNRTIREFAAEFLGTFLLMSFGNGSVAAFVYHGAPFLDSSMDDGGSTFFTVNWGYAVGLVMGVMCAGGVSGAHLNPAVTGAMAALGKLAWWKMFHYMAAQYLGSFVSSCVVYSVYYTTDQDALEQAPKGAYDYEEGCNDTVSGNDTAASDCAPYDDEYYDPFPTTAEGVRNVTRGIYATYKQTHVTIPAGFWVEFFLTALLLFCVMGITDRNNMKVSPQLVPLYLGLMLLGIGIAFGRTTGYAMNPARDFAPRLFTALAGWGWKNTFGKGGADGWFWVPIVAPHLGAIFGATLYLCCIGNHIPVEEDEYATLLEDLKDFRTAQPLARATRGPSGHPSKRISKRPGLATAAAVTPAAAARRTKTEAGTKPPSTSMTAAEAGTKPPSTSMTGTAPPREGKRSKPKTTNKSKARSPRGVGGMMMFRDPGQRPGAKPLAAHPIYKYL